MFADKVVYRLAFHFRILCHGVGGRVRVDPGADGLNKYEVCTERKSVLSAF